MIAAGLPSCCIASYVRGASGVLSWCGLFVNRKMIQFRIAYGRRLYGLLCRHTVAGVMCGALCELLLYNIVVARCVALYGRRRYFLYRYQSAAFAACVASSDVVRGVRSCCIIWLHRFRRSLAALRQLIRRILSGCLPDPSGVQSVRVASQSVRRAVGSRRACWLSPG